jgi:thioesterase domain-containing protein
MELADLAKYMRTDHPIYGIQARGLDSTETPLDRVEDMAQYYINFIREMQPKGPYFLVGLSSGGLVQLEVAQRLSGSGEEIGLLAFLDTWPHTRYWPFSAWLGVLRQRAKHHLGAAMQLGVREAAAYVVEKLGSLVDEIRLRLGASSQRKPTEEESTLPTLLRSLYAVITPELQRVRDGILASSFNYPPRYYRGKITYLRAGIPGQAPEDPALYWGKLAREFEVHTLPCDHVGMIGAQAEIVAVELVRCFENALGKGE